MPFSFSTSASEATFTRTTLPRTTPFVPAVHAFGIAHSGKLTGAVTCAVQRSKLQPRPNGNVSSFAF